MKTVTSYNIRFNSASWMLLLLTVFLFLPRLAFGQGAGGGDPAPHDEKPPYVIAVSVAGADTICVGGTTKMVSAHVSTGDDSTSVAGATVSFSTNLGSVTPTSATTDAQGNASTTLHSSANPGTATVTASVSWPANAAEGISAGSASNSVKVYFIGGAITGDHEARYFCSGPSPWTQLTAATGQPTGTTYAWSVTAGGDKLDLVGATNQQQVNAHGIGPSSPTNMFDVTVKLTYSKSGQNCESTYVMQVRQPQATLNQSGGPVSLYYSGDPIGNTVYNGFDGQYRRYLITDQANQPMAGVNINEIWDNPRLNPTYSTYSTAAPTPANGLSDANGYATDSFNYYGYRPPGLTLNRPNEVLIIKLRQRLWLGSATSGLGCGPFLNSPDVEYHTNGVRGW